MRAEQLAACEVLVYGGGLYAGGLNGAKKILADPCALAGKELVLFTCGLADPADGPTREHIRAGLAKTLPEPVMGPAHLFFLRGGMDYARLSLVHRAMMAMLRRMLLKKGGGMTQDDRALLAAFRTPVDFVDISALAPLVAACGVPCWKAEK